MKGGCTQRTMPAARPEQSAAFHTPILTRRKVSERRTVKSGSVNIMVSASPMGRNARHLEDFDASQLCCIEGITPRCK